MEFDKSKVYTALNADELEEGYKVIVGDNLLELQECVLKHKLPKTIKKIESEVFEHRFLCDDNFHYALAYKLRKPEKEEQLAKAEEIIRTLYYIIQGRIDYEDNIQIKDSMDLAKAFLNKVKYRVS